MEADIAAYLMQSADAAALLAANSPARAVLVEAADAIAACLRAGGKLLVAGNGGSAADAQHIAAEFVSRLLFDRAPMAALALTASGPILTACGNDYGFPSVFARQVAALGRPGDVLLALSTSGNSANLVLAAEAARERGMVTLAFSGQAGGHLLGCCDHVFRAPSPSPQIVQQLHMQAAHAVLAAVERALFSEGCPS